MKQKNSEDKATRVLSIFAKLREGKLLNKAEEAVNYNVNERTIQRDIEEIRRFLDNQERDTGDIQEVVYDRERGGYRLNMRKSDNLESQEILTVCKILLESRALVKSEMYPILDKLIAMCTSEEEEHVVKWLIDNEMHHYLELHHGKKLLNKLWMLETAVKKQLYVKIRYRKLKGKKLVERKIKPVGVMFSEFYFYLTAFIEDIDKEKEFRNPYDLNPTIYRVDRLEDFEVLKEHFRIPYRERFEEGEFRKRVPFMFGGKLQKVRFRYKGLSVEAILDKLPTAEILSEDEEGYVIQADVFGTKGIEMWLRGQGEVIEKLM